MPLMGDVPSTIPGMLVEKAAVMPIQLEAQQAGAIQSVAVVKMLVVWLEVVWAKRMEALTLTILETTVQARSGQVTVRAVTRMD